MATGVNSRDKVAENLHQWALKEMQFQPQGRYANSPPPSKEQLVDICRGPMIDIWKYVVKHVKSSRTVHEVKGNLTLQSSKSESCGENGDKLTLAERRQLLRVELQRQKAEQTVLEKDLRRLQKEYSDTELSYQGCTKKTQLSRHRAALIRAQGEKSCEEVAKYNELDRRIRSKIEKYKSLDEKISGTVFFSRKGSGAEDGLESACCKSVRESCESTRDFLHLLLQGKFNSDTDVLPKRKDRMWSQVENVMLDFPVSQILMSVILNAEATTLNLAEMTRLVDIRTDAEKLRFKYEGNGQLLDTSTPPSLLSSVHKLLEESQSHHIARFLETQKSKNRSWKLETRLNKAKEQAKSLMDQTMYSHPGALELARALFDAELDEIALRTTIQGLHDMVGELQENIFNSEKEREHLYAKQQKIYDFKSIADSKQNLIAVLVKQNSNAKTRLQDQQVEILRYIQNALCSHEVELTALMKQLHNSVHSEMEIFSDILLPYLVLVTLDSAKKMAVVNLSIKRLHGNAARLTPVTQVLDALEFPAYKAPECLLGKAIELKEEIDDLQISCEKLYSSSMVRGQESSASAEKVHDICRQITQHDNYVLDHTVPQMKRSLKQATDALGYCIKVKDSVNTWWEQPGQGVAHWLEVDEQTLQQWKHKWTIAVTKLRLMEMKQ